MTRPPRTGTRERVLLIAPQPFFRVTGTPINVLFMCRALTEGGYHVDLLTLPHDEDVTLEGLTIRRVPPIPGVADVPVGFSPAKALYDVMLVIWSAALLLRHRYVAVHGVEEAAFFAAPLARLFGLAAIADLDSDLPQQLADHRNAFIRALAGPSRWFRRQALHLSSIVISVARHMTEISRRESPGTPVFEIQDIPMDEAVRAPDADMMVALRTELDLPDRRLIVYTGNYDRRQGLEELVSAMPRVLASHPDAALVVIGGKPEAVARLLVQVDSLGLWDDVRLIGPRPPDTMAEYMGMADVLVSPRLEPYATPLKIFSYMASGRPIVATDLPTHTEVLDAETAFLVPPTVEGLSAGLLAALDDPAAAERGAAARRRVEACYTFAIFQDRLLEAYTAILGRNGECAPASAEGLDG
jgi:glycosyltransferase involved in cell wall biosynthesis